MLKQIFQKKFYLQNKGCKEPDIDLLTKIQFSNG